MKSLVIRISFVGNSEIEWICIKRRQLSSVFQKYWKLANGRGLLLIYLLGLPTSKPLWLPIRNQHIKIQLTRKTKTKPTDQNIIKQKKVPQLPYPVCLGEQPGLQYLSEWYNNEQWDHPNLRGWAAGEIIP